MNSGMSSEATMAQAMRCLPCECTIVTGFHLSIELLQIKLQEGEATAISYAWGEWNRAIICIGHTVSHPQSTIFVELGEEWVLPDLWHRLAELSETKPVWMDQICIPKNDTALRLTLASIPLIYNTFDVVTLLPGSTCGCVRRHLEEQSGGSVQHMLNMHFASDQTGEDQAEVINGGQGGGSLPKATLDEAKIMSVLEAMVEDDAVLTSLMRKCHNAISASSWFTRFWTRQELLYSRSIRAVWNVLAENPCVFQEGDAHYLHKHSAQLTSYLKGFYNQELSRCNDIDAAKDSCFWFRFVMFMNARRALQDYLSSDLEGKKSTAGFILLQLGLPVQRDTYYQRGQMQYFLQSLEYTIYGHRSATLLRDYVLAIWVDCPEYKVPPGFANMSLLDLLQDVGQQLEEKHHGTLSTTSPAALFSPGSTGSFRWDTRSINSTSVTDVSHAYGSLNQPVSLMPITQEGMIPISLLKTVPEQRQVRTYHQHFFDKTTCEVLNELEHAAKSWTYERIRNIRRKAQDHLEKTLLQVDDYVQAHKEERLTQTCSHALTKTLFERALYTSTHSPESDLLQPVRGNWSHLAEIDHHSILYPVVCSMLSISLDVCQAQGLEIIVSEGSSFRLGLANKSVIQELITAHSNSSPVASRLTVWVNPSRDDLGNLNSETHHSLFEIILDKQQNDKGPWTYRVAGVWIPAEQVGGTADAIVDKNSQEAFII